MKKKLKKIVKPYVERLKKLNRRINPFILKKDVQNLYSVLYALVHDLENPLELAALQTKNSFSYQWSDLKQGKALLNDPWFKQNVTRILSEEEILIKSDWFKNKEILDAGCGNGRWSYGFAKLGANVTSVDINESALNEAKRNLAENGLKSNFYLSSLETLSQKLPKKHYDLVFCWGVLHHCKNFNKALSELVALLKDDGILYLYLYGRESIPIEDDIELFKQRLEYHSLSQWDDKYKFLLKKAGNNQELIHNVHDIYAPLINRRFTYSQVKQMLEKYCFENIEQTIVSKELFIRAIKNDAAHYKDKWILPGRKPPYWYERYQ